MNSQSGPSSLVLTRRAADGTVEWIPLEIPARIPVGAGEHFALIDRAHYEAPEALVAKRDGDDLVVEVDGAEVLVLGGFFVTADVAFYPTTDIAGGAGPFSGRPVTADTAVLAGSPEGEQVVWSGEPEPSEAVAAAEQTDEGGGAGSPLLWGGLALGGLGLAAAAGGGGGGGGSDDPVPDPGGDPGGDPSGGSDDEPPTITSADTAEAIDENSGAGQVVYTATATDEGPVTWSLEDGGDAAVFSIDPETGEVTLDENPDFETKSSYTFTVVATDSAGNSVSQTVSLPINDIDDDAPHITSGARATAIDENSGAGQVVYTAAANDDGPVTWSLADDGDAAAFSIDETTGEVTLTVDPDHEAQASYTFTVVATDADGNTSSQRVTLAVNDLDEVAPTITSPDTAAAIDENSGAGQVVYTVTSTDDGDVSSGETTYSLAPGGDADRFTLDAETGAVTLADDPDFETKPSYSFTVVATDAAGNSSQKTVTLPINDLNDSSASVQDIQLTDASGAQNGILNAGDTVRVTVTMNEAVDVDTTGGTPRIALNIGDATVFASYVSGGGSASLIFEYTIQEGENDDNGISVAPNALEPNGGAIIDAAGSAANLGHGAVPSHPEFLVDTTAPTLSASTPEDGATEVPIGSDIVLTFSEDVIAGSGSITIRNGSDERTIDVTDTSQVSIDGNQVTIDPSDDLNGSSAYRVQIESGAFTDSAGNAVGESTLDFETGVDTSIVVFDLVQGASSDHSGRTFDSEVSYDIYIRVRSEDADLATDGGAWSAWRGAANLGSDDKIYLVGDGEAVHGPEAMGPIPLRPLAVNEVSLGTTNIVWDTPWGTAASLQGGDFARAYDDDTSSVTLFDGPPPAAFFTGQGGAVDTMHLVTMPNGILTSQGLGVT